MRRESPEQTKEEEEPVVMATDDHHWWQTGVIYQIYPRSFMDSDGDGVGDLPGIRRRLDYLDWLGVDAIWISPIFPSPMVDFGYDISDYTDIHPLFGTMEDFDRLLDEAHDRDIRVILDLVPNHTSDQHPWFQESRSSRDNPKRDWYIWEDPAENGDPPTNWISEFGGSAWEWDERTEQYYYHAFFKEQPDLNWRNPEVREAMYDIMRFWLDKGVDGFRIDVLWHLIKDDKLRDNPTNPDYDPETDVPFDSLIPVFNTDRPEVHDIGVEMREVTEEYETQRVLIGEIYLPITELVAYYGEENEAIHLPFNFHLILTDWTAEDVAAVITQYEAALPAGGWPNWVLGNHDQPRFGSRVRPEQRRVAAMLLLTLRGTPTIYYGEEIGMLDTHVPPDQIKDPKEQRIPQLAVSRDPARTPMQWDTTENAGFTTGSPWLPINDNKRDINVAAEKEDRTSVLHLYRQLISLHHSEPALHAGQYRLFSEKNEVLAYVRKVEETTDQFLIALNFSGGARRLALEDKTGELTLSTHLDRTEEPVSEELELRPDEGVIIRVGG